MAEIHSNKILIGVDDNNIYLKACGSIRANSCFALRKNLYDTFESINEIASIYFDLSEIEYMDSTFMGLLAGLQNKSKTCPGKSFYIIKTNDYVMENLEKMQLHYLLKFDDREIPEQVILKDFEKDVVVDDADKLEMILTSHEDLSDISEKNKNRFLFLTNFLKKQIKRITMHT